MLILEGEKRLISMDDFSIIEYYEEEHGFLITFPVSAISRNDVVQNLKDLINDKEYCVNKAAPQFFMWYKIMLDRNKFLDKNGNLNHQEVETFVYNVEPLQMWVLKNHTELRASY